MNDTLSNARVIRVDDDCMVVERNTDGRQFAFRGAAMHQLNQLHTASGIRPEEVDVDFLRALDGMGLTSGGVELPTTRWRLEGWSLSGPSRRVPRWLTPGSRYTRFLRSLPALLILSVMSIASVGALAAEFSGRIGILRSWRPSLWDIAIGLCVAYVVILLHELAHVSALAVFGAEARGIGVGVFLGAPTLYCDVSSLRGLSRRYQRVIVPLAGPAFQLIVSGLLFLLADIASTESLAGKLELGGVLAAAPALINLVPVFKLDGYVALTQLVGVENLNTKAVAFLRGSQRWTSVPLSVRVFAISSAFLAPCLFATSVGGLFGTLAPSSVGRWLWRAMLLILAAGVSTWIVKGFVHGKRRLVVVRMMASAIAFGVIVITCSTTSRVGFVSAAGDSVVFPVRASCGDLSGGFDVYAPSLLTSKIGHLELLNHAVIGDIEVSASLPLETHGRVNQRGCVARVHGPESHLGYVLGPWSPIGDLPDLLWGNIVN